MLVYVTGWQRSGQNLIVATHSHCRLAIADLEKACLVRLFHLPSASAQSFDLSGDGSQLVTGYDGPRYLDLWSVERGTRIGHFKKTEVARVRFDATATHAVTWDLWKGYVVSFKTNTWTRLLKCGDLYCSYLDVVSNTMYVPVFESPFLYEIRFDPVSIEKIELPLSSWLYTLRKSPTDSTFIYLYEDGRIECRDGLFGALIWSRQHVDKEITSNGSFCGDGRFFALNVGELYQYWVLDAAKGEIVHKKNKVGTGVDPRSPLPGAMILCSNGVILDAESGEISPGVSSLDWWSKAGMPPPDPI